MGLVYRVLKRGRREAVGARPERGEVCGVCQVVIDGKLIMRDENHLNEQLPADLQLQLYEAIFADDRYRCFGSL